MFRACPDDGDRSEQGVLPVLLDPVGDLVDQIGFESAMHGKDGEDGVLDAPVLLAAELDFGQLLREDVAVGDAGVVLDAGDGPAREGSQYRAVDRVPGRTLTYTQTIVRYEQDQLFEESWDGPMAGHSVIRFDGDEATTTLTIEADVATPLPGALSFLEPIFRMWARRMFDGDLSRLDELITEGRS